MCFVFSKTFTIFCYLFVPISIPPFVLVAISPFIYVPSLGFVCMVFSAVFAP